MLNTSACRKTYMIFTDPKNMKKTELVIWISGILLASVFLYYEYWKFSSLDAQSKAENLRWLSSALIQSFAAILAIVPAVALALQSFFTSRYPSRLRKNLWKGLEWYLFFLIMVAAIITSFHVLVSIPTILPEEYTSNQLQILNHLLILDTSAILMAFFVIGVVLRRISAFTNIEKVFEEAKHNIAKEFNLNQSLKEIRKQRKSERKDISLEMQLARDLNLSKTDEPFEDYFSLMISLAETRDLTGLKIGIMKLFDLMLANEIFYEKVIYTLGELLLIYSDRQILPYTILTNIIHKQYLRVSRSKNPNLIKNVLMSKSIVPERIELDTVPKKLIVEDFYRYRVQEEGYTPEMNPVQTIELAEEIVNLKMKKDMKGFWTVYAANMTKFMITAWQHLEKQGIETIGVINTIKKMLERTETEEAQKVRKAIETLGTNLKRFHAKLEPEYLNEFEEKFLDWLEEENERHAEITPFENTIKALHKVLH